MNPFLRNLGILALVAVLIVVLNAETALVTASLLLRVAFFVVIGVVVYFFWRDVARHEISTWSDRSTWVFYAACALLVVDIGWWIWSSPSGRDALAAIVVAAICAYVGVRTWREQRRYS
jgi:amino acid transporter